MPYSAIHPPDGDDAGQPRWRHPVERTTELYFEAEMAMTMFHKTYREWIQTEPKASRVFQLALYKRYRMIEGYYNTPKEQRFNYFSRRR